MRLPTPARCMVVAGALLTVSLLVAHVTAADPEIVSVKKIWDDGKHNAFTDLIRFKDRWFCSFREGDGHVGGDGKLRILESQDGATWQSAALLGESGIDLRDPKLSITADGRLMVVAGGSVYEGKTLLGRRPRVAFSADGHTWTPTQKVLHEGEWLWRVTWHDGTAYGIAYDASKRSTPAAQEAAKIKSGPAEPGPADWKLRLYSSKDGVNYELITHLDVPGHPNESTLRFTADGTLMALVRREGGNAMGWIGSSKAPFKEWKWHETGYRFGGPNFIVLPNGDMWAGSRHYPGGAKTMLAKITANSFEKATLFPSGGDNSYPGFVWHDGHLWMSYYSSHEGKSAIYIAKIKLP